MSQSVLDFEGEKRGHKISLENLEDLDVDGSNYDAHQENSRRGLAFICLDLNMYQRCTLVNTAIRIATRWHSDCWVRKKDCTS
jgi:hypothetical protein